MQIWNYWKISVNSEVEMLIVRALDCPDVCLAFLSQVSLPCQPLLPWGLSLAHLSYLLPPMPWAPRCPLLLAPHSDTLTQIHTKNTPTLPVLSISHFHHHPVRMGEGCLSSSLPAVTTSNLTRCDYASAAGGSSYLTEKSCFPSCEWEC